MQSYRVNRLVILLAADFNRLRESFLKGHYYDPCHVWWWDPPQHEWWVVYSPGLWGPPRPGWSTSPGTWWRTAGESSDWPLGAFSSVPDATQPALLFFLFNGVWGTEAGQLLYNKAKYNFCGRREAHSSRCSCVVSGSRCSKWTTIFWIRNSHTKCL